MASKDDDEEAMPGSDEFSKKFSDLFRTSFPGMDLFQVHSDLDDSSEEESDHSGESHDLRSDEKLNSVLEFNLLPRQIKEYLDRFVIRQDEAKKTLAIAVCDHYNHAKYLRKLRKSDPEAANQVEFAKQNVIILGPTGVGKTYLVKHIADLVGVPFVKADATKFSETGYVGGDVDDLVRELVQKADGDVELAQYGIIYIDEIDKIASSSNISGRDVSGRGVQTTLLKLMEETDVTVRNSQDIHAQMQALLDRDRSRRPSRDTINTRNILFVVSGAFSGLQKIMERRLHKGAIGFLADGQADASKAQSVHEPITHDFIEFGFEAEFIGRLPVRVVCESLDADDLFEILKHSEGSIIRQYEREFESFGIRAEFQDAALHRIAEAAAQEKTGARGLMTVCEKLLRNFKYELPGTTATELVITEDLTLNPAEALAELLRTIEPVADPQLVAELAEYQREFEEGHGVRLDFAPAAALRVGILAAEKGENVQEFCARQFRDFQYGLSLVKKNTGKSTFTVTVEAVDDPDRFLSGLVIDGYRG